MNNSPIKYEAAEAVGYVEVAETSMYEQLLQGGLPMFVLLFLFAISVVLIAYNFFKIRSGENKKAFHVLIVITCLSLGVGFFGVAFGCNAFMMSLSHGHFHALNLEKILDIIFEFSPLIILPMCLSAFIICVNLIAILVLVIFTKYNQATANN